MAFRAWATPSRLLASSRLSRTVWSTQSCPSARGKIFPIAPFNLKRSSLTKTRTLFTPHRRRSLTTSSHLWALSVSPQTARVWTAAPRPEIGGQECGGNTRFRPSPGQISARSQRYAGIPWDHGVLLPTGAKTPGSRAVDPLDGGLVRSLSRWVTPLFGHR